MQNECVIVDPISALSHAVADNNSRLCCPCKLTRKNKQHSSRASRLAPTDSFILSTFKTRHDRAPGICERVWVVCLLVACGGLLK